MDKNTAATYSSGEHGSRVVCTISKRYDKTDHAYWFCYHKKWADFLDGAPESYIALGCVGREESYLIPNELVLNNLHHLNFTIDPAGSKYWHIHLIEDEDGALFLKLPKTEEQIPIQEYSV